MQKKAANTNLFNTIILEFPTPLFSNTLGSTYKNMDELPCCFINNI